LRFSSAVPHTTYSRVPSLAWIVLLALAVHGPLLLMQLPSGSYDANTHMFFASHYANHWFSPWNEKWFAGFSQTTYPPLIHQLIALFSHVFGLTIAYMFIQGIVILFLPIGVFRYARLWVSERAAIFAAIGSIFLGSLAQMVYQSGQINTTFGSVMMLNALPFFYVWIREGRFTALLKGVAIFLVGSAGHHVTMIFGSVFFSWPVIWLAIKDRKADGADSSVPGLLSRTVIFAAITIVGVGVVLLPYWIQLYHNPITQAPIYHESRANYILVPHDGMNFWVVPFGALILALPYIFWRGSVESRLRPLFFGFFLTLIVGLGGTTPVPRWILGRAWEVLTYERFSYWATLMALPIVGLLAVRLIDLYRTKAIVGLTLAAVGSCGFALYWRQTNPIGSPFSTDEVISFLNRDNHSRFRYLTLGFGPQFSKVSILTEASTVDGEYNSARLLPELTVSGSAKLSDAKYFGANGMEALRAMLKHADHYGLKYIFVRDRYYEPLLAFAGWRPVETYDNGNLTLWSKEDIAPARKIEPPAGAMPSPLDGFLWGTLPLCTVFFTLALLIAFPDRRRITETLEFPAPDAEPVVLREAK
jgi:hypothetical protein